MEFKKATFDEETVAQLIDLSKVWEKEEITFGLRSNTKQDLNEPCFIAIENDVIVGYAFGHFEVNEKYRSFSEVGDNFFFVDEVYVIPELRGKGIGKTLFKMLEEEVKDKVKCITLSTATKDYKKILNFYVEELGMTFHDAYLFKKF